MNFLHHYQVGFIDLEGGNPQYYCLEGKYIGSRVHEFPVIKGVNQWPIKKWRPNDAVNVFLFFEHRR